MTYQYLYSNYCSVKIEKSTGSIQVIATAGYMNMMDTAILNESSLSFNKVKRHLWQSCRCTKKQDADYRGTQ